MMGTFSKSFGSHGGYIAASSAVIQNLRHASAANVFGTAMSPACAAQAFLALDLIRNNKGAPEAKAAISWKPSVEMLTISARGS